MLSFCAIKPRQISSILNVADAFVGFANSTLRGFPACRCSAVLCLAMLKLSFSPPFACRYEIKRLPLQMGMERCRGRAWKGYSSHLVQYAGLSAAEMSMSGQAWSRHSSEQKVRMSSTSHPSSIGWWQCSQTRTSPRPYSPMMSSKWPSTASSSTIRTASRLSRPSLSEKKGFTFQCWPPYSRNSSVAV